MSAIPAHVQERMRQLDKLGWAALRSATRRVHVLAKAEAGGEKEKAEQLRKEIYIAMAQHRLMRQQLQTIMGEWQR